MHIDPLFIILVFATFAALLLLHLRGTRRRFEMAEAASLAAAAREAEISRILGLAAEELRAPALALLGHAQAHDRSRGAVLAPGGPGALGGIVGDLLRIADDLQDHAASRTAIRTLREGQVRLGELVAEAIHVVCAMLGPGRRHWRVAPELGAIHLTADPRALRQVLIRVLANAVRFTASDDWIDVLAESREDGLALVVEDEGLGIFDPGRGEGRPREARSPDSRGLGLGLVLARALMEAHGGTLLVESAARVGTRVSLFFPAARLSGDDLPRLPARPVPAPDTPFLLTRNSGLGGIHCWP